MIVITTILLFNIRDLSDKPIIDVVITSLTSIISSVLAASVAYYVARLQLNHQAQDSETKRKLEYLSALQLLSHEIQFNKQVLDVAVAQSKSDDLAKLMEKNLIIDTWKQASFIVIHNLDQDLLNETSTLYYNMSMLKQGFSHTSDFIQQTYSKCVEVEARIKVELQKK
ncbi:hypothetical protein [Sporosarcina sp. P17b]|uniref:hypothetical protein n=1 Tax=Sporosarcina sp. P17b TaxID=2048260 RepID=UPI001304104F|nr:hypothetical protein [Sporosarcina sp. P17b]